MAAAMDPILAFNARWWPLATLALLVAVTSGSLIPAERMPPGGFTWDKAEHFVAYGALALPVALARPRGWGLVLAGLAVWSGAIELLQPLVNRRTDAADMAANLLGIGLGVGLAALIRAVARNAGRRGPKAPPP
jgi:VanZ family protein